jgi:hypothetical protein
LLGVQEVEKISQKLNLIVLRKAEQFTQAQVCFEKAWLARRISR